MNSRICSVCLVEHDEDIHAATLSVHDWFHGQVTQGFREDPEDQPVEEREELQLAV